MEPDPVVCEELLGVLLLVDDVELLGTFVEPLEPELVGAELLPPA